MEDKSNNSTISSPAECPAALSSHQNAAPTSRGLQEVGKLWAGREMNHGARFFVTALFIKCFFIHKPVDVFDSGMSALHTASVVPAKIQIDAEFLLQKVSELIQVKQNRLTWNEFGERIAGPLHVPQIPTRPARGHSKSATSPEPSDWCRAKELVHAVLASREPKYEPIRNRLFHVDNPSTAALLSTLSLWAAGKLRLSVTITQPMVAVMLYAVDRSSGNWSILLDRYEEGVAID